MTTVSPLPIIGVDDGNARTKVYSSNGGYSIRSLVSLQPREFASTGLGRAGASEGRYLIDGQTYAVGDDVINSIDPRFDEYTFSAANMAVAVHAILQAGITDKELIVVNGLPLTRYYDHTGTPRKEVIQRKQDAWRREVRLAESGEAGPVFAKVKTTSQAVVAWADYIIDNEGQVSEDLASEMTAVIDPGGGTTDIAVVKNGEVLFGGRSDTIQLGMLDLYDRIATRVIDKFGLKNRIVQSDIEAALRTGVLRLGRDYKIDDIVEQEKHRIAEEIKVFVQHRLARDIDYIRKFIFVGGGSVVLEKEFKSLAEVFGEDRVHIRPSPDLANARGMFKYGLWKYGQSESA